VYQKKTESEGAYQAGIKKIITQPKEKEEGRIILILKIL